MIQTWMALPQIRPASRKAEESCTICEESRIRRRSTRSARTPPKREKARKGASPRKASRPSRKAEPVIVRISQFWATSCIQVPTLDVNAPAQSRR